MAAQLLRLPQVKNLTGQSRSSIYLGVKFGSFPKPIKLGMRSVAWISSDIENWINGRIKDSRNAEGGK